MSTAGADEVLVVHDHLQQVVNLRGYLKRSLGNNFAVIDQGTVARPLPNAELCQLVRERPGYRAYLTPGASLIGTEPHGRASQNAQRIRSLLPVAHPIARVTSLYRQRVGFNALDSGNGKRSPEWFVTGYLATSRNNIIAANFQTAHLLGGKWGVEIDEDMVREIVACLCDSAIPLLADFQNLTYARLGSALLKAEAPVAQDSLVPVDADNTLLERLQFLKDSLPAKLFAELCRRNVADLKLFESVIVPALDSATLSDGDRAKANEDLAAAAALINAQRDKFHPVVERPPQKGFVNADPVLGWWPMPLARFPITVLGRPLVMETDEEGYRPVTGQNAAGTRTLWAYGCSFTYGWSVAAEETFCSLLQKSLPAWRIENRGVIGFGSGHNLIQLERDTRFQTPEFVTFCHYPYLVLRAAADFEFLSRFQRHPLIIPVVNSYPKAYIDERGNLAFRNIRFVRPEIAGVDHRDFVPDPYYLDLLAIRIFKRAAQIVLASGGTFFITLVRDRPSQHLLDLLAAEGIPVVDAGLVGQEWTNLPDDPHPNVKAHQHYAAGIHDYLVTRAYAAKAQPPMPPEADAGPRLERTMENLRTIPDALAAKAKSMGIQPCIHNADFLFEHVLRFWKGDLERALHNYYDQGKGSSILVRMWVDDYCKSLEVMRERNCSKEAPWSPKNVLDFAAGYGRLSRHLPSRFPNSKIQTCDIHPGAVDFNTNVLKLESYSSAANPEDLKIPQQDVIICLSFFSHIPRNTYSRWLKQLVSFLSPQGILLFTAHGHVSHTSGPVKDVEIDQEGFGFRPKSEQKDLDTAEYGTTISFPSYVLGLMSQCDDVRLVRFQEGLWWQMQDAYMFART